MKRRLIAVVVVAATSVLCLPVAASASVSGKSHVVRTQMVGPPYCC